MWGSVFRVDVEILCQHVPDACRVLGFKVKGLGFRVWVQVVLAQGLGFGG